jgi:hypothetical protein
MCVAPDQSGKSQDERLGGVKERTMLSRHDERFTRLLQRGTGDHHPFHTFSFCSRDDVLEIGCFLDRCERSADDPHSRLRDGEQRTYIDATAFLGSFPETSDRRG